MGEAETAQGEEGLAMTMGETIETAIRELVKYCHSKVGLDECIVCPFNDGGGCKMNMWILEGLVHFADTEIIPRKEGE